jgi:hypothetical protein
MTVGVHAVEVFLAHRCPIGNTHFLYTGEITACGAEYPVGGFTLEEKSESRYTLPTSFIFGIVGNASWIPNFNPKTKKIEVFSTGAAEEAINAEVDVNEDVHSTFVGAPILLISSE